MILELERVNTKVNKNGKDARWEIGNKYQAHYFQTTFQNGKLAHHLVLIMNNTRMLARNGDPIPLQAWHRIHEPEAFLACFAMSQGLALRELLQFVENDMPTWKPSKTKRRMQVWLADILRDEELAILEEGDLG